MHIFYCAVPRKRSTPYRALNKVENRARDNFRDLWDCGAGIKNAEVGHFVESRRGDASGAQLEFVVE
jgi:hypothetical protein